MSASKRTWVLVCDHGHVSEHDFRGAIAAMSAPCPKKTCQATVRVKELLKAPG